MSIDDADATTQILQLDLSETPRVLLVDDDELTLGHAAGDAVLQEFVRRINQSLGTSDWCARIGGEEFVVVLGNADREAAHQAAEAIRVAVAAEPVQTSAGTIRCTVSIGISGWPTVVTV